MDEFVAFSHSFLEICVEHQAPGALLTASVFTNLLFSVQLFSLLPRWRWH